ncbi:hypothetical protein Ciccas_003676 [Cichlidogyrus casuarinus]|uniref:Uncharacterized protein n=1 Tax=Cichlidogyrus casuarinus TaxID=1844966 RepID=A0ABD2QEH4_9PLAT
MEETLADAMLNEAALPEQEKHLAKYEADEISLNIMKKMEEMAKHICPDDESNCEKHSKFKAILVELKQIKKKLNRLLRRKCGRRKTKEIPINKTKPAEEIPANPEEETTEETNEVPAEETTEIPIAVTTELPLGETTVAIETSKVPVEETIQETAERKTTTAAPRAVKSLLPDWLKKKNEEVKNKTRVGASTWVNNFINSALESKND